MGCWASVRVASTRIHSTLHTQCRHRSRGNLTVYPPLAWTSIILPVHSRFSLSWSHATVVLPDYPSGDERSTTVHHGVLRSSTTGWHTTSRMLLHSWLLLQPSTLANVWRNSCAKTRISYESAPYCLLPPFFLVGKTIGNFLGLV